MKIAALYARVSTSGQEKEETINSQIAEIESKATADDNILGVEHKFIDNGWSGALLARPGLDQLRDAIKQKQIEVLYVYDLGRLSRDFLNQLILKNEIQEAGIKLISLHDINADNPEQLFAQNVMGLFHDYERIKIAERMRRGKLYKTKKGVLFGWQAPYGYIYIKGDKASGGKFEINHDEAKVIRMMYEWVGIEYLTIRKVIKRLHKLGIQSREGHWATSTLSKRLRDETYIGNHYYNKTLSIEPAKPHDGDKYKKIKKSSRIMKAKDDWNMIKVPAIINQELFDKVQKQLVINSQFSMRNKKYNYLLSGVINCRCGCTRAGEGGNQAGQLYYRCTDRVRRFPLPKVCQAKGVNAQVLDEEVWNAVSKLLTNPSLVKDQAARYIKQLSTNQKDIVDRSSLEKELQNYNTEEQRYLKAYGEGLITFEKYKEQATQIKLKRGQIMSKLSPSQDTAVPNASTIALPDLNELCVKIADVLSNLTFEKKRSIIRQIIKKVETDAVTATITGYIPLKVENTHELYEQSSINRNRGAPQCGKVYPI